MIRLFWTTVGIVTSLTVLMVSVLFFGPKIGGIFGFLSKYRNKNANTDIISPPAPIFLNIPAASKDSSIDIKGFAEAGSKVTLFVNGPSIGETLTDAEGSFTFYSIKLISGHNTIFAKAKDVNGNESVPSDTMDIVYDKDQPQITITSPQENEIVKNLDKRVLIKGSINKKAIVKVNGRIAILKPDLTFEILLGVEEGKVTVKVEAIDEAGNKADKEFTITYQRSS